MSDNTGRDGRLQGAHWECESAPTPSDEYAVRCELVAADGTVWAACLWASGELDVDSDGCGPLVDGLCADDIDWIDEDDAKNALITDDDMDGWYADDGNHAVQIGYAESAEEAAQYYVYDGDWGDIGSTIWVRVYTWRERPVWVDGELLSERVDEGETLVAIDPPEPQCTDDDHDWRSPHEIVGGIAENPGVWGHGGGVTHHQVCAHCGTQRHTDTWAQDPDTGTQGLTSVRYEEATDETKAWARSTSMKAALEGAHWECESAPTPNDENAVGCELVAADGTVLAGCLWASGELDVDSDGCGPLVDGLCADDIDWIDEDDAKNALVTDDDMVDG